MSNTKRPTCPPPNLDTIPKLMRAERRWCPWRYEWKTKEKKWGKVPIDADGNWMKWKQESEGETLNPVDGLPKTWMTFDEAVSKFRRGGFSGFGGIGFFLGDGWAGIDFDDHLDPTTKKPDEYATSLLTRLNSRSDISPSGEGVKVIVRATITKGFVNHTAGIEIYGSGRFFTVTGHRLNDYPADVEHRQEELTKLLSELSPQPEKKTPPKTPLPPGSQSDRETAIAALSALSSARCDGYFDWLKVGQALHSVDTSLLGEWDSWSRGSAKYAEGVCAAKWATFNGDGGGVSIGSLCHWADQDSPGWRQRGKTTGATAQQNIDDTPARATVQNFVLVETETDGERKFIPEPLPITTIGGVISKLTGGWPRSVGGSLFVPNDGRGGVSWIPDTDALFAYFGRATGHPPEFKGMPGFHTKREVFADMLRTVTRYAAVEELPHEPPMPGHFYACDIPPSGNGARLNELVNRFSPETDIDRDLILAAIVTPFWGGSGGTRPAFCITSDAGKGCGKSTLAASIGQLAGGALDVSANEDIATVKARLLSPEGVTKRVVWLDNVKSHRLSWAELESLITTPTISGKRLYVGEGQRPNTLTFILTMNGVSLSTDMAQRSVIIKLRRPDYSGTWAEETRNFIEQYRHELVADVLGFLRSLVTALPKHTRWGDWERDILARLPEPSEAQAVIRERQVGVDVDGEESALIEEFFSKQLTSFGYDTKTDRVFIPSRVAAHWFGWATDERMTVAKASRTLKQRITEGQLGRLMECGRRDIGRGFEFWGDDATGETYLKRDLEDQIKIRGERQVA